MKQPKYNATEVHITHSAVSLFITLLSGASLWAVRKLTREVGFLIYITAGLLLAGTLLLLLLQKKRGEKGKLWGLDFFGYFVGSAASAHLLLALSRPIEFWTYTAPICYVMLGVHWLIYVSAVKDNKSFSCFAWLSATAGLGIMGTFQTYYNLRQLTVSTQIIPQQTAFTVGWTVIAVAAVVIAYIGRRTKQSFWKEESVVVLFALFWGVLQMLQGAGSVVCYCFAGAVAAWYILLRVLVQIRVIR